MNNNNYVYYLLKYIKEKERLNNHTGGGGDNFKYIDPGNYSKNFKINNVNFLNLKQEEKDIFLYKVYEHYNRSIPMLKNIKQDKKFMFSRLRQRQNLSIFFKEHSNNSMNELKEHKFLNLIKFMKSTKNIKQDNTVITNTSRKFLNISLVIIDNEVKKNFNLITPLSSFYIEKILINCSVDKKNSPFAYYQKNYEKLLSYYFSNLEKIYESNLKINLIDFKDFSKENLENSINPLLFKNMMFKFNYSCTLYKSYIFKNLVEIFKTFKKPNILDLSSGWGDRLLGALSIQNNISCYTGIDPNDKLHEQYKKMIKDFCLEKNKSKFKTFVSGSENVDYSNINKMYDFVFWSPPFYDREIYTESFFKAIKEFKNYEDWEDNFLLKSIEKTLKWVKKYGVYIFYLGNINFKSFFYKLENNKNFNDLQYLGKFAIYGHPKLRSYIVFQKI